VAHVAVIDPDVDTLEMLEEQKGRDRQIPQSLGQE